MWVIKRISEAKLYIKYPQESHFSTELFHKDENHSSYSHLPQSRSLRLQNTCSIIEVTTCILLQIWILLSFLGSYDLIFIHIGSTFLMAQWGKNLPAGQETQETWVPSLGQEDSRGETNGKPLQCSCLENTIVRGAWRATVHGVEKSRTQLSNWMCTSIGSPQII